jgi:hypothetical protein
MTSIIRYIAPFSFSTRNVATGDISGLNITASFGVAVYVMLQIHFMF